MDAIVHERQVYFANPKAMDSFTWSKGTTPPWYGQGNSVGSDLSVEEMLIAGGLDWEVEKRPIYRKVDGVFIPIKDKCELTRKSDSAPLSIVGKEWHEVQNRDSLGFFDKFVREGNMKMEAVGSLWGGKYIWALARVNADFVVGPKGGSKEDRIGNYVMLCSPHVLGKATILQHCSMRFFCWNTMTFDLGASLKSKGHEFRIPHSMIFSKEVQEQAAISLKLAVKQSEEMKEAADKLASSRAYPEAVEEFFRELLDFKPEEGIRIRLKDEKKVREPLLLPKFREALVEAPGQQSASAEGTWWGAVNAVTAVIDHQQGRKRETALRSAWIGAGARMKREALKLALEKA